MTWYKPADVGFATRSKLADLGYGARLFFRLLISVVPTFRRFGLVRDQMHFLGNYSLAIIAVSGLFVGFVFGLQGYYTLIRYGSSEALGLLVTLTLVRELGPVVTALLFAGRAGTSLTAEIGLMKAGEQISVMEMMAVDPDSTCARSALLGRRCDHAAAGSRFQCHGCDWRMGRWRPDDWCGCRLLLESDPGRRGCLAGRWKWHHQKCRFRLTVTFIAVFQGFEAQATPEGVASATTRTVVVSSLSVLGLDFILTAMMFTI
jgi:phospholipid/cholesterol/gamma-HCH transport system permease protein